MTPNSCTADGCYLPHLARGMCRNHYNRARKYAFASLDHMERIVRDLGSECAICKTELTLATVHFDHDHACCPGADVSGAPTCGRCLRGILCSGCNTALGAFKDDPRMLMRAIRYLEGEPYWSEAIA